MAKIVTVTLDTDSGSFSVDITGFQGQGCADVIRAFEQVGRKTAETKKPEYYQKTAAVAVVKR